MAEVSTHELKVYRLFRDNPGNWLSSREVASRTGIAPRTARLHTSGLVSAGILDEARVFPGYRYRLNAQAEQRPYYQVLRAAELALS